MRYLQAVIALILLTALAAVILIATFNVPTMGMLVPILAVGLAFGLQRYIGSFFGYFVITFSHIYDLGDRIRIGNVKGDVRRVGFLHTTLEEVGEDEKMGGELTGRILQVPNLIILDQPVLNYTKDYTVHNDKISSDYLFDEVRIPITCDSDAEAACQLLEDILKREDEPHITCACQKFQDGYPKFLTEAMHGPRVLVHIEPQRIWIKGQFVVPTRQRNQLKTRILLEFFKEANARDRIKLA